MWFKLTEFLEFIRKTQYKRRLLEFRDLDLRSKSGLLSIVECLDWDLNEV